MFAAEPASKEPLSVSGIYPHLAMYNGHGECGVGAVVPWAGKLWVITYPPHMRTGSNDKLYEIGPDMSQTIRDESTGGTHANRLIHRESKQLIIGPYFIDEAGKVRVVNQKKAMPARLTATARHLTDPANKVYFFDMEGPGYEVDVKTLDVARVFVKPVPGWHGKGAYTGQGRLVISNNGDSPADGDLKMMTRESDPRTWSKEPEDTGVLAEWDGKTWNILQRRQFTDVTGPGGIQGNPNDDAPLWAMGWDKRSVILAVCYERGWSYYRLPKASHAFDPKHGWYTEWPRIRETVPGKFLLVMHGMMYEFPQTFEPGKTAGIRPLCSHLRYIPDIAGWNDRVILAADDTSIMQNPLAGQSQSNLQFIKYDELQNFGPRTGWGSVWLGDHVKSNTPSEPYLFAGFAERIVHLSHKEREPVTFTFEIDRTGDGTWEKLKEIKVPVEGYEHHTFATDTPGEWIRVTTDKDCHATVKFDYRSANKNDGMKSAEIFASVPEFKDGMKAPGVKIWPAKEHRGLEIVATIAGQQQVYWVDEELKFSHQKEPKPSAAELDKKLAFAQDYEIDSASVIVTAKGQRFRLPLGAGFAPGQHRATREAVSERHLADIAGTWYEIPRIEGTQKEGHEWRKIKPVATHGRAISDFCTWRGLFVIAGVDPLGKADGHLFTAADKKIGLWFGAIDDLWKFGKPRGRGGPWKSSAVKAGEPSDPYLMTNYDRKTLNLKHDAAKPVSFTIEVDLYNSGLFRKYKSVEVAAGETLKHEFPAGYQAHWVRLVPNQNCMATAEFIYE
jgi:hypothetical protein